jgi:N-acetylglucosamine-6-phosphate deacetylase
MARGGLIDLHIHGSGVYDTSSGKPGGILRLASVQGKAGIAAMLPTIYAGPIEVMRRHMAAVSVAMDVQRDGAKLLGVHLEGPFLNPGWAGAQPKEFLIKPTLSNFKKLVGGFEDIIKIITIAPELPGALKVIERCTSLGIRVNMGHSNATLRQAIQGKRAGATGVTHLFNAMRPFHHREPGLAGAGLVDDDLYVEVIPDGVHLLPETIKLIFRTKPEGKIILVSDSIKGPQYKKGVLQGSTITLSQGVKILKGMGINEKLIERAARINPKRYLKGG